MEGAAHLSAADSSPAATGVRILSVLSKVVDKPSVRGRGASMPVGPWPAAGPAPPCSGPAQAWRDRWWTGQLDSRRPSGQCPGRHISSGLCLVHQDSAYFLGTQDVPVQAGVPGQSRVGDGLRGPAPSGTAATRTVQLAYTRG